MRLPNGQVIRHEGAIYDPAKAHEYYLRTRKLKGRKKGSSDTPGVKTTAAIPTAERKKALAKRIAGLEAKLKELDALIAKKEKAAKEVAKPDTAADKSEKARDAKKYRSKHKQELATKAKRAAAKVAPKTGADDSAKSGGSSKTPAKGKSLKDLKMLATKVRGQIQTAKAKLGAL